MVLSSQMSTIAFGLLVLARRRTAVEGYVPLSAPFVAGLGFKLWRQSEGKSESSDPPCAASDQNNR